MEKYDYTKDREYLEYLKREKKDAHAYYGDDALENPNLKEEKTAD